MLEAKKSGFTLYVAPTKLVGDVAVSMCFPVSVDGCALARLNNGNQCGSQSFPAGSEESAVCHSLYLSVRQVLCGDPLAVSKTKVGDVQCGSHNGQFFINWKVKGTVSAARKSIGLALKMLNPGKMYAAYSRCLRELGGTPKRETFAYVADQLNKAIKNELTVGIVGNIKCDQTKLNDMLDVLSKKHEVSPVEGAKSKPTEHIKCDHLNHTEVKVSGWASSVLSDYLNFKIKGLNPALCDKFLLLPMKAAQWATLSKKLKKNVKDYVQAKYAKVADDLPELFGYLCISSSSLCACDVQSMIKSKLNASAVEAAISKYL
jgi:hypothetical protein